MLFIIPIIGVYKRISKALVPEMPAKFNFLLPLMMYLSKTFNAAKLRVHTFPLKMYLIKRIQFPLLLLCTVLFINSGVFAQSNYPIFVSPTLTPPYSLKLSDYCKFGSQQLMVSIVVNDLNVSNLPVKLHIKLETVGVTIETPVTINTTPIFLDGGATNVLYGEDLKDYFDINNLVFKGYSKDTYKKTGQLPEGFYKITVEVLHFQTNRLISNQGSVTAWMALGKPPVLRLPENNIELGEFKGVPVVFSWLASNVGSPVSAGSVQYKFEMWEMRVNGISPYTVAATVPVFHEETTQKTMVSVYPSSLLMEPGMKYAWRVTATDLNGLVPFEQDGHSEIRIFTYKTKCDSVKGLKAKVAGNNGTFTWESAQNHTSYNIELKNPSTGWSSASETFENKAKFYDLNYGSTYKMRVQAVCDGDVGSVSDFSEWKSLVVPLKRTNADTASCPNCKCDDNLGAGKIENIELRHDLKPGDTIVNRFGTTRFIVKSVEPQGDGVYKGHFLFWAEMWKLKFLCEYWDLSVNTDNVIVNMDYESVYNPQYLLDIDATTAYLDKLAGDINELTVNAVIKDTISVNETITSVYVNAGDSIVAVTVGPNGELHEVVIQTDSKNIEQTMVKGQNGEEYVVTRDGEVMGVKEYQNTGGGNSRKMDEYIKEKESKLSATTVDFSASPNQKYGYDAFSSEKQAIVNEYPALKNSYRPAYKSIASYSPDKVIASASGKDISFRDEMGIPAIGSGTELTVRGGTDGDVTVLYAYKAVNDSTEEIAGKLNLMSFDEQARKLYIIPVNNAQTPDAVTLQNTLNKVYGQAVTRWEVVKINKGIDVAFENGAMTHGGSNAISVYNSDQKAIINKFNEADDFEDDALYLFFIDNVQSKTGDIAGYMPLQRQVGFIYDNPSPLIIAHELGHGAFNLRHPFSSENFIASQGSTTNLMDYKDGSELWKHQWNLIHDPENILFAWSQKEEEGEMLELSSLKGLPKEFFNKDDNSITFLTPSGNPIVIPANSQNVRVFHGIPSIDESAYVTGVLYSFQVGDEKFKLQVNDNVYSYKSETKEYTFNLSVKNNTQAVWILPNSLNKIMSFLVKPELSINRKIETERNFPIKYPTAIIPNSYHEFELTKAPDAFFQGLQEFYTEEENELVKNDVKNDVFIPLLKIGQLRNAYPAYFDEFCDVDYIHSGDKIDDDPSEYSTPWEKNVALKGLNKNFLTNKFSFYNDFLDLFLSYIIERRSQSLDFWANLNEKTSPALVVSQTQLLSENDLSKIPSDKIILAINLILLKANMVDDGELFEDEEQAITRLIQFSSDNVSILNALIGETQFSPKRNILKTLMFGVDDKVMFYGNDNYKTLISSILWKWTNSPLSLGIGKEIRTVNFNDVSFYKNLWDAIKTGIDINFEPKEETRVSLIEDNSNKIKVQIKQDLVKAFVTVKEGKPSSFDPYEPIFFVNHAKLSALDDFTELNLTVFPAIFAKYADQKGITKFREDLLECSGDVLSIATAGGALMRGGKLLAQVISVVDLTTSSANLVNNIAGRPLPEKLTQYLMFINLASSVVDMGSGLAKALAGEKVQMPSKEQFNSFMDEFTKLDKATIGDYLLNSQGQRVFIYLDMLKNEAKLKNYPDVLATIEKLEQKMGASVEDVMSSIQKIPNEQKVFLDFLANKFGPLKLGSEVDFMNAYNKTNKSLSLTPNDFNNIVDNVSPNTKILNELELEKVVVDNMEYSYPAKAKVFSEGATSKCYIDDGFCFISGTPIFMKDGKQMPIEKIKSNDSIVTFNHTGKQSSVGVVKRAFARVTNKLCKIVIAGSVLISTPDHSIFANHNYIEAKDLLVGDKVLTISGEYRAVESVSFFDSTATVYSLEVTPNHNYFAGNPGILVHNSCGWQTIREAFQETEAEKVLFRQFSDNLMNAGMGTEKRRDFYRAIAELGEDKKAFIKDFAGNSDMLKFFSENPAAFQSWKLLNSAGSKLAKLDPNLLKIFNKLDPEVQKIIARFSDSKEGSTLQTFLRQVDSDPDFLAFVNNIENKDIVALFVAHKGEIADDIIDKIHEANITNAKAQEWIDRSEDIIRIRKRWQMGNDFQVTIGKQLESLMKKELSTESQLYRDLRGVISDLDERTILSQVQFCITGKKPPCSAEGEYFIADFVFAKKVRDPGTGDEYWDFIIADSKLSEGTPLTKNQESSLLLDELYIKASKDEDIIGITTSEFKSGVLAKKSKKGILKIFGDGNGNYAGVGFVSK